MPADSRPVTPRTGNPAEITEGAWHHARNRLPFCDWENDANGESFKVPDLLDSDAATIYVRINDRHFVFDGGIQTSHSDCCRHVAQSKAYAERQTARPAFVSTLADDRLP